MSAPTSTTANGRVSGSADLDLSDFERLCAVLFDGMDGYYLCVASLKARTKDEFSQSYHRYPVELPRALAWIRRQAAQGLDCYFGVHLLTAPERTSANAAQVRALWQDIDGGDHRKFPPTVLIQSSESSYQGFWLLDAWLTPDEARALNERLARDIGADSGFGLAKLLRVPGTENLKYGTPYTVRVANEIKNALGEHIRYDPEEFAHLPLPSREDGTSACPLLASPPMSDEEVLRRAFGAANGAKVRRLFDGDTTGYDDDESRADEALLSCLAFWTQDEDQLIRLMRGSVLWDKKWERPDYQRRTLAVALRRSDTYQPRDDDDDDDDGPGVAPPAAAPAFPLDVFPEPVRGHIRESATAIGVAPETVGVPFLGYAGAAMGRNWRVKIKEGYEQYPVLWIALVLPPGGAKSPALNAARHGLDRLQARAGDRHKVEMATWKADAARARSAKQPDPPKPVLEHFFTTNATMEAVALMASTSPGFVVDKDELVSWVKSHDAYRGGKGSDREDWLSSWSSAHIKADRKVAESTFVDVPHICIVGGIQPDKLPELAGEAAADDGFLDRLLWSVPDSDAPDWTEATVDPALIARHDATISALRYGPGVWASEPRRGEVFTLAPAAYAAWIAWYNANQADVRQARGLRRGMLSKLSLQTARLALILHALHDPEHPAPQIPLATMLDAMRLAAYFRAQAERVLPVFARHRSGTPGQLAARVLAILERREDGWVSRSDIYAALKHGKHGASAKDLDKVLRKMVDAGQVKRRIKPTRTNSREEYRIVRGTDPDA